MAIELAEPSIGPLEQKYVSKAMRSTYISGTGPYVDAFARGLAERTHREYCLPVANGTLALELALRTLGVGPGDEVLVPAFTFAAPANAVLSVGATPVLVDVSHQTLCIDSSEVPFLLTERTKAVIVVNSLARIPDYEYFSRLGIPVIEDAAQSHGSCTAMGPAGSHGDISTFSFHANKTISTGEGGAILTNNPVWFDKMKLIANHGMTLENRYFHRVHGSNYRMTNVTAAIGTAQIERWDELVESKKLVERLYDDFLADYPFLFLPEMEYTLPCIWLYTLSSVYKNKIIERLNERGVRARSVWPALSYQDPFNKGLRRPCPVSEDRANHLFFIPTHSKMDLAQVETVGTTLTEILDDVYNRGKTDI